MISFARMFSAAQPIANYEVSISPQNPGGLFPPGAATTGFVECNVQNQVDPVSYLWEYVSGDVSVGVTSTTAQRIQFTCSGSSGQTFTATWKCTATDSDGVPNVGSDTVTVTFIFEAGI